ncbi:hypothetical protein BpHYR1_042953 [Brachionus plicatilis]|uniref:Uncharacterized protein n=1 Tax=Brachionus plicatilis TaxID=10195 RepID=A0A3M7SNA7_BRAPC|nr:hypothetical protein BpHYR1_042953 [Brachionus plicatilis]
MILTVAQLRPANFPRIIIHLNNPKNFRLDALEVHLDQLKEFFHNLVTLRDHMGQFGSNYSIVVYKCIYRGSPNHLLFRPSYFDLLRNISSKIEKGMKHDFVLCLLSISSEVNRRYSGQIPKTNRPTTHLID